MASEHHEATCESDPNFAVICGFLEKFGVTCGLSNVDFLDLQYMLENNNEVPQQLIDLHVKLLRKARKSVSSERWERALVKVCHGYGSQDAWEIERFGYRKARLPAKLRILKQLLEMQFDYNAKFKSEINKLSAEELRTQPLGRDRSGHAYWFQADDNCQIRVYKEDPDEETWDLVAKDREGLLTLINQLTDGKELVVNEDSNSLESDKPVIDTGQSDSTLSNSDEKDTKINGEPSPDDKPETAKESKINSASDEVPDLHLEENNKLQQEEKEISIPVLDSDKSVTSKPATEPVEIEPSIKDIKQENQLGNDATKGEDSCTQDNTPKAMDVPDENNPDKQDVLSLVICTASDNEKIDDIHNDPITSCDTDEIPKLSATPEQDNDSNSDHNFVKETESEAVNVQAGLNLTVKSPSETLSIPEASKRMEICGVKEKYMRSDVLSVSSSVHHRKAVDSAGYSVHTKYLKSRVQEDTEEEFQEPAYMKRPRLDRPTLLGYRKKRKMSSESSSEEEYEPSVSDEVEEPLMLVKGEGSGHENTDSIALSPIISNVVEEAIMYFTGEGSGYECETGNDSPVNEMSTQDDNTTSQSLNSICNSSVKSNDLKLDKLNEPVGSEPNKTDNAVESHFEDIDNTASNTTCEKQNLSDPQASSPNVTSESIATTSVLNKINSENITNNFELDKNNTTVPFKVNNSREELKGGCDTENCETKAATSETGDFEKVPPDKNFSKYLEEKSRLKLNALNCTDIVNNVKQSPVKNRPKKILNYKPKKVDTNCFDKTDNIVVDVKENDISKIKCDDSSNNKPVNCTDKETAGDVGNGAIDKCLHNDIDNDTVALRKRNTSENSSVGSEEGTIKTKSNIKNNLSNINIINDKKHNDSEYSKTESDSNSEDSRKRTRSVTRSNQNRPTDKIPSKSKNKKTSNCKQIDDVSKNNKSVLASEGTKRELRQRLSKISRPFLGSKKKNNITKDTNQIREEHQQESKSADTLCKPTEDKTNENKQLNDTDDDMEIDDSVNHKTMDIISIEHQIVKPSEITSEPIQLKCVEVQQDTINKIREAKPDGEPVIEPICVKKKMPLLTIIDINKLKGESDLNGDESNDIIDSNLEEINTTEDPLKLEHVATPIAISDSESCEKSSDVVIFGDSEPLTLSEESSKTSCNVLTSSGFKIDIEDSIPAARLTRKRAAEQSINNNEVRKRPKVKGKRAAHKLRRSIEKQKLKEVSSSEDDVTEKKSSRIGKKKHKKRHKSKHSDDTSSSEQSSDISDSSNTQSVKKRTKPAPRKKTLLGLDISPETESILRGDSDSLPGVRQSRRIAQIKIKEEAERRKLEEQALQEHKEEQRKRKSKKSEDKDYKGEKKKKHRKHVTTEEETTNDIDSEEKKKRKRKRKEGQFDAHRPWKSSSGSSSSEIEEEEEEAEPEEYDHHHAIKSDHEFSPESDLEGDTEWMPLKRARTVRKEIIESDSDEQVDDCPCQKCGKSDHPEWILLCDSCDSGWHCSCLRPPLLVIPEGAWFCPPCQHTTLVKNLETRLLEYEKKVSKKEMEIRRKERLAYVGISLDNVLPTKDREHDEKHHKHHHVDKPDSDSRSESDSESDSSDSDSKSSSSSSSDSEPIYQLRERRQAHSYRFNDYDDLINSAIQDELDAVKGAGNQGRGKDISTIVNAEKEELQQDTVTENGDQPVAPVDTPEEPLPPVVPIERKSPSPQDSDDEPIRPVRKILGRKKHRKLNSLDVSSEDDAESDEDFKGSSNSESDEDFDDDEDLGGTDSSERDARSGKRRKDYGPIRRSTRARISRYDRDFINDNTDSEGGSSKRKKSRPEWDDETESEESDRSWGRRKRRNTRLKQKQTTSSKRKKLKKKRRNEESDPEVYRRRPKLKFGGLSNTDELESRRTRGKKINYLEALGTDSDEEVRRKPPRIEDSEEEYIVQEDDAFKDHLTRERNSDESDIETALQGIPAVPTKKPRGRGKCGLKIARSLQEEVPLFPPISDESPVAPLPVAQPPVDVPPTLIVEPPVPLPAMLDSDILEDDEPNHIELINKNVEAMNEQEMKKMMEEEDYANKQLQLLALQIEKERKRKEREAQRLQKVAQIQSMQTQVQKVPMQPQNIPMQAQNVPMQTLNVQLQNQNVPVQPQHVPMQIQNAPLPTQNVSMPPQMLPVQTQSVLMQPQNIPLPVQNIPNIPIQSQNIPLPAPNAALPLQIQATQNTPKKRGRKPKNQTGAALPRKRATIPHSPELLDSTGMSLPAFSSMAPTLDASGSPTKRRGRGKGKKTLAAEAAAIASTSGKETPELEGNGSLNSNTSSPAPSSPVHGSKLVAAPPQPFSQSQPTPSVITRMLQSQPSQKYFPGFPGPRGSYQQPPPPHYPVVRSGPAPPHRLPQGLPPMYHSHRSIDPTPPGNGPVNIPPATTATSVPVPSNSPLSKVEPAAPPPPYTTSPQLAHFPPGSMPSHLQHRVSTIPPFHPGAQSSNFYGTYVPPPTQPSINTENEPPPPPVYPGSYDEQYASDNAVATPAALTAPTEGANTKQFDEETGGEFGGLVSYFSSQQEDDLDT